MPPEPTSAAARFAARYWLAVVLVLLLGDWGTRFVLPLQDFYFRGWEWANKQSGPFLPDTAPGPFYANAEYTGRTYGDLANATRVDALRAPRPQRFTTDGYGYRNPRGRELGPWTVVLAGDSFAGGAGMSDDQTMAVQLERALGAPVYNVAPRAPRHVFEEARFRARPPALVVWQLLESTLGDGSGLAELWLPPPATDPWGQVLPPVAGPAVPNRAVRFTMRFSEGARVSARIYGNLRWWLTRTTPGQGRIVRAEDNTLFSWRAITQARMAPDAFDARGAADGLARLRDRCAEFGTRLVVVVVPDKSTIYRELMPARYREQLRPPGELLARFQAELDRAGVPYVDLLAAFRREAAGGGRLYQPDDTHWNPTGAQVAAAATAARLTVLR